MKYPSGIRKEKLDSACQSIAASSEAFWVKGATNTLLPLGMTVDSFEFVNALGAEIAVDVKGCAGKYAAAIADNNKPPPTASLRRRDRQASITTLTKKPISIATSRSTQTKSRDGY